MPCLIIVDAWKNCEREDIKNYPWLERETKHFGAFINVHLPYLRVRGIDIIHASSGREIMDEIPTYSDLIISSMDSLPVYDYYYFCGFHLGRCINKKIKELDRDNCGIVYNLSLVFPQDSHRQVLKRFNNNYLYSKSKGFEKCNII